MRSLSESLFDKDMIKDDRIEYLFGMVEYIEYISDVNWKMPDWHPGYTKMIQRNLEKMFDMKSIDRDFNKIIKRFGVKDWTEFEPDNNYSYAKPQKNPYKEVIRKLIYIIVGNIKTIDVYDFHGKTKEINTSKFQHELQLILKKYAPLGLLPNVYEIRGMCQINIYTMFDDEYFTGISSPGEKHFFKIKFKTT